MSAHLNDDTHLSRDTKNWTPEFLLNERMELLESINDLKYAKATQMKDLKPD